jgi:SAM-dependent methyltransferase
MGEPDRYSFQRYLEAKKSVDDRALNRLIWEHLREILMAKSTTSPPKIVDVGAGVGSMLERMLDWGLVRNGKYLGLDIDAQNITRARQRFLQADQSQVLPGDEVLEPVRKRKPSQRMGIEFIVADMLEFAADCANHNRYDLVMAHAVLDLLDLEHALAGLIRLLKPGSYFYATINFDGLSIFEPVVDDELDEKVIALYQKSMDDRLAGGTLSAGSRTGRQLFLALPSAGAEILAAGGSDWVVHPKNGIYPDDEAYFLYHILHFIEVTLSGQAEMDSEQLLRWLTVRRAQIEKGVLVYIAHQMDFLAVRK